LNKAGAENWIKPASTDKARPAKELKLDGMTMAMPMLAGASFSCARPCASQTASPLPRTHLPAARRQRRPAAQCRAVPSFIPAEPAAEVEEPAARAMLNAMQRVQLQVPGLAGPVHTTFVGPQPGPPDSARPAFILLHGFDSSLLEFRRFQPLLATLGDAYAVDLAGWGFSDCGFAGNPQQELGPPQKRAHLRSFVEQVVGRPVVLLGASLGGAVAVDFALEHPELVKKLVLVDAQGFIDGIGPMASMPRALSVLGVQVLRTVALRQMANKMAYADKQRYATDDAMRVGRLHTHMPGWTDANVAFMRSGGYSLSQRLKDVACPALVVWGRQDEILSTDYAQRFLDVLPDARLVWVEECGHVPALEQPQRLLDAVAEFVGVAAPAAAAQPAGAAS
jgi:pimeloyl-ACP methyl ester carboxylesterase